MRSGSPIRPTMYLVLVAVPLPITFLWLRHSGLIPHSADWMTVSFSEATLIMAYYLIAQRRQLRHLQKKERERESLFQLISENAADMIALVDVKGHRLYNSPAYQKILGYSAEELEATSSFEQIHPEDRHKVIEAADFTRTTGEGMRLEYRMKHKCGDWMVLESTASAIRNQAGEVVQLVIVNRDITERKKAEEKLQHHALHDALTDLPNRSLFLDRLQHSLDREHRSPTLKVAVIFLDIDGFKKYNDTMGHVLGDELIVQISQRLSKCLRSTDTVTRAKGVDTSEEDSVLARLGSDEFTILLDQISDASDAMRVAKRIQDVIAPVLTIEDREFFMTACIGISLSSAPHRSAENLLRDAGTAMYRAKAVGKGQCQFFDQEMHRQAVARLKLETDLHRACEQKEFRIHYQPIVRLDTGRVVGFETLLRWKPPDLEMIRPAHFISVAEETGLIVPIGRWILHQVCRQAQCWASRYPLPEDWAITVNVSGRQLKDESFVTDVREALAGTGFNPSFLHLEITESMAMENPEDTCRILEQLKQLGIGIGIDDFGVGHSSFSRLRGFPVDLVKIDQSFIANLENDPGNIEIVRLMLTFARTFALKVIAEGVEKAGQVAKLKELGCEFAQGYFYSEPLEAEDAERLLSHPTFESAPKRTPAMKLARAAAN